MLVSRHYSVFDPNSANGKHFKIHWKLRRIHCNKYVKFCTSWSLCHLICTADLDRITCNDHISRIQRENWKTLWMVLHGYVCHFCILFVFDLCVFICKFLHVWHGQRIILFNVFDGVRIATIEKRFICIFINWFHLFCSFSRLFPFDWKTPLGYFMAWLSEVIGCYAACVAIIPVLSLIFALSWLFVTIANHDLIQDLVAFNIDVKASNGKDHGELMRHFCKIVQCHSDVKE